ncbi:DUF2971 domain-containing protein [Hallella mizrahii]|uniref:DUF2971 domain-containing protein n=1 Tax=Hallella mizrahii TaxID=2606637 RepID=A0A7K0KIL6_9BACT|nr:DUF2971 domain-containing protein [Hallella mizrahii]MST85771.1 DUF2971 domain-containing protein [Hallella mizrahii]
MSRHSFKELVELISNRLDLIEVDRDKFTCESIYNEEELIGWINVRYNGKIFVIFQFLVTNLHKDSLFNVRGSFTVKYRKYSKWFQDFLENGGNDIVHVDEFFKAHFLSNDRFDITYFLDKYIPIGNKEGKTKIADMFADYGIDKDKIVFDTHKKAYMVELDLSQYLQQEDKEDTNSNTIRLYKYMSLDTYLCMLNNQTFRMNSIISMNDIYEGEWIHHLLYGSDKNDDNRLRVDNIEHKNILVTSLTDHRDDGSMWRLYGNNGLGVCMGFDIRKSDALKVIYINEKDENFRKLHEKLSKLNQEGISLSFKSAQDMQYIVKSSTFNVENEYRFIFDASSEILKVTNYNSLLSSYKDFPIDSKTGGIEGLPFGIKSVIIGHSIPNYNTNISILMSQTHEVFPSVSIYESEVKEIR